MMKYTVRYAHLEELPAFKTGDIIRDGTFIGRMGNTGKSDGAHLHIDCVIGMHNYKYRLADIMNDNPKSAKDQLDYFIDGLLFKNRLVITTQYLDPEYFKTYGKQHPAYDVVPKDPTMKNIYWNRSKLGLVLAVLDDPAGYGNNILIGFEA